MTSITQMVSEYETQKKIFEDKLQAALKAAFVPFFESSPEVRTVEWTQYTPYFNDGDPCTFGVGDIYYSLQTELYADENIRSMLTNGDYSPYELDEIQYDGVDLVEGVDEKAIKERFDLFSSDLSKIPNGIFESAFGDHARVRVSRTGVEIEEYDHD